LTDPLFAYSLLYPYTDNYLDDPDIPAGAKQALDDRLRQWLGGRPVPPHSARERDILRLVEVIHRAYPASAYPDVHDSLRAIHRAQVGSLAQQSSPRLRDQTALLQISVEKGGTSVLTDGYLVAGRLSHPEAEFLFGYGVVLQLLDDLQDIRRDLRAGHATLFTKAAASGWLDGPANRLLEFLRRVLRSSDRFAAERFEALKELLERSCRLLLLHAVAASPEFFTGAYSRQLEASSPFRFRFIRERRATLEKAFQKAKGRLKDRHRWDAFLRVLDQPAP
jgi:hypothetical protein